MRLNANSSAALDIEVPLAISDIQLPSNSSSTGPIPTITSMFQQVAVINAAVHDLSHSSSSAATTNQSSRTASSSSQLEKVCYIKIPDPLPFLEELSAITLSEPKKGTAFTDMENKLFLHILNNEAHKIRKGTKLINWKDFSRRWQFWGKVLQVGKPTNSMPQYYLRSEKQLAQKMQDGVKIPGGCD